MVIANVLVAISGKTFDIRKDVVSQIWLLKTDGLGELGAQSRTETHRDTETLIKVSPLRAEGPSIGLNRMS